MTDKPTETNGLVTIKIDKAAFPGPARGAVNGRSYEIASGKEVPVAPWVIESLRDSHVPFTVVNDSAGVAGAAGAEGSASAAVTLERTANRAVVETPAHLDPTRAGPPVIRGGDEVDIRDHGRGVPEPDDGAGTEDGESVSRAAGAGTALTGSESGGGGSESGQGGGDAFDATTIADGTVTEVTGKLDGLSAKQLAAVRKAEEAKGGDKVRKGVLAAIEAAENELAGQRAA